ncbi:MAG: PGPGW domain-containing protein [Solirubrobacterales bacterium]
MRDYLERTHEWLEGQHESHRDRHPVLRAFAVGVGIVLIPVGIVLIPLPGPGFLLIGVGLGILSLEFHWPRRMLRKLMDSPLMGAPPKSAEALPAQAGGEAGGPPRADAEGPTTETAQRR